MRELSIKLQIYYKLGTKFTRLDQRLVQFIETDEMAFPVVRPESFRDIRFFEALQ